MKAFSPGLGRKAKERLRACASSCGDLSQSAESAAQQSPGRKPISVNLFNYRREKLCFADNFTAKTVTITRNGCKNSIFCTKNPNKLALMGRKPWDTGKNL